MRRYASIVLLYCALLSHPTRSIAQRPLNEEQRVRLGISSDQQTQMEAVFTTAGTKRKAIQAHLHGLYHDLHDLYEVYTINSTQASALQNQILAEHRKLILLLAENETKTRTILNSRQFETLHTEMKADRERFRHEHPRPEAPGQGRQEGPGHSDGSGRQEGLVHPDGTVVPEAVRPSQRIGITFDQQKQLEAVFTTAGTKRKMIQAHLHGLYHDLHDLYEVYTINSTQASALQNQILAEHRKLTVLYAENETKIREVLNSRQFEKLRAEMKADRERFRREHPQLGGRGREHPEGSEPPLTTTSGQRKG